MLLLFFSTRLPVPITPPETVSTELPLAFEFVSVVPPELTESAVVEMVTLAFFALLFALNHLNLSLVAPAAASLTLVTNAVAGKIFLKENVDRRRWTAAILVCLGVYFLAH